MIDAKNINTIVQNLLASLPEGIRNVPKEVEKNFKGVLEGTFEKMHLVTREEFEVQTNVLLRTREKLERLEKRVAELELQN